MISAIRPKKLPSTGSTSSNPGELGSTPKAYVPETARNIRQYCYFKQQPHCACAGVQQCARCHRAKPGDAGLINEPGSNATMYAHAVQRVDNDNVNIAIKNDNTPEQLKEIQQELGRRGITLSLEKKHLYSV